MSGSLCKNSFLPKPRRDSEEKGVLTPVQFLRLIQTTFERNEPARAVLYLLAGVTGLRRKELLLLTWRNIHLDGDAFVRVPAKLAKNGKEALQPIAAAAVAIMKAYKAAQRPKTTDRVF